MKGPQVNVPRQTGKGNPRCALMAAAFAFAALSILPLGDRAVFGQCHYELTSVIAAADCDTGPSVTFAQGLNLHGHVVGYFLPCAIGNERAFFWSQETGFVTLPTPPDVYRAWAYAISDTGLIVGQHGFAGVGSKGFIYDMNKNNGEYIYLEPVHEGVVAQNLSSANAVNSEGVVAGMRVYTEPGVTPARYNAVIWRPLEKGAPVQDLGILIGPNSFARDIDASGMNVAGWDGFSPPTTTAQVWKDGVAIDLGPIPEGDFSWAFHMNTHNVVTGTGVLTSGFVGRAFLWDGDFTIIPPPAEFTNSTGGAINDLGQFLITCTNTGMHRPFLWQHGEMVALNDLAIPSITLESAIAINNAGQILLRVATHAVLVAPANVPFADLNYDCRVDYRDLVVLLEQWGPVQLQRTVRGNQGSGGMPSADLNGDGIVNVTDLLILFDNWSQ